MNHCELSFHKIGCIASVTVVPNEHTTADAWQCPDANTNSFLIRHLASPG